MQQNYSQEEYGFQGRLKPDFPSQIIVDVTERCNFACIHCPHSQIVKTSDYSASDLPIDLNTKLVDEVREYGKNNIQYIRYSADGEPLLHPHLYKMIGYAVKNANTFITLTTNGSLLTSEKTEKILETGVHLIDISVDAYTEQTYKKIRKNGNLAVTQKNIQNLLEKVSNANLSTKVVVSFIEQPENKNEKDLFVNFWKDNRVDSVVVRQLHSAAGANTELPRKMGITVPKHRRPCLYPWERIVLNPRGYLSYCPAGWAQKSVITDYRSATIHETWQSSFYKKLRQAHLISDYQNHGFCGQCQDWSATIWPNQGRSYASLIEDFI